jgi:CRP-like cAMP-binding protein
MTSATGLQDLIPINSLAPAHFQELVSTAVIANAAKGDTLFRHGATDNNTVYVLAGEVELIAPDSRQGRVIVGGTEQARYPLAQLKPRQFTGKARSKVTIACVPSDLLDRLLTWDQVTGEYEVTELAEAEDAQWIMQVLRNRAFQLLPPTQINELFTRLESMTVKSGQVIIRQGDSGDYFYLVKEGRCSITRKSEKTGKVAVLGELAAGESFGEEALLSDAPRNASVAMMTDGIVTRLSKQDFDELLKRPLIRWVKARQTKSMLSEGAGLVDVRLEDEYRHKALRGSINIPLYLLRLKVSALDPGRSYILYCETGNRSSAAAFLLSERGFDVYVLEGGLAALRPARAATT